MLLNFLNNSTSREQSISSMPVMDLKADSAIKDESFQVNETNNGESFSDVLKSVDEKTENTNSSESDTQISKDKIKEKVDEIEEKIAKLKDDSDMDEETLEKLETLLNKIKEMMSDEENSNGELNFVNGTDNSELWTDIGEFMDKLSEIIDSPGEWDQLASLIDDINGKMQQATLVLSESINIEELGDGKQQIKLERTSMETNTGNESTQKVEVIDLRTEQTVVEDSFADESLSGEATDTDTNNMDLDEPLLEMAQVVEENHDTNMETDDSVEFNTLIEQNDSNSQDIPEEINQNLEILANKLMDTEPVIRSYTNFTNPVNRANLEALMQGIAGKAVITLRDGNSELRMKLFPPELGQMNMKFTMEDGQMAGKIVVSTQEAKMLFDQNLYDLQNILQESGINIGSLDVSLADGNGDFYSESDAMLSGESGIEGLSGLSNDPLIEERSVRILQDATINYVV